jgi:hypothetical protein
MNFVEWLAAVATPFLFATILYFLKEQKEQLIKKVDESSNNLKRLQNEIYEFAVEAKKLNEKTSEDLFKTKELVKDLHVKQTDKFAFEIVKLSRAASQIEFHAENMGKVQHIVNELEGKIIFINQQNERQNKVLKILIERIKKD